jgi:type I restriction enzyme S subunit
MQFKPYPLYIPCDIHWFNEIPQSWKQVRVEQYLIKKDENIGDLWDSTQLLSLTQNGIIEKDINDGKGKTHSDYSTYQAIDIGDLVFCLFDIDETPRTVGLSTKKGMITSAYTAFKSKENINTQYVYYFFESLDDAKALKPYYKGLRKTVRPPEFLKIHVPFPPKVEQVAISQFLDTETARIDTLIAKQEKLIELLEEQRKSIISHAVTKGLNPNAPMKDSGVEWLGDVPNDWNFSRLDAVSKIVRGNSAFSKMDLLESGKYVALQYGKTYKVNEINESFGSYVNQEFFKKSQITEFGDIILISTSETLEDLGHSCFYARHDIGLIGGEQFLLKPKNQNFGKYIYYATKAFSSYLQRYATGLKVFRFNLDDLKKIYIPDISLVEQQKIAEFLDKETARIDISVLKQKSLIEKLKEYRSSIISHAVTGKINVQEFGA